jgi:integrase/recombinase XerC
MAYYAVHRRPHRTMTELEQAKVLKVTGEHARGFRDHVLFALALGTGLREHEALALDVGDITEDGTTIKRRITLRVFKRCTKRPAPQEIFLPDSIHSFHVLRHTACTNLYRKTRDIRLVQRFARHVNIHTTTIYAQPTEEDLMRAVRELPC